MKLRILLTASLVLALVAPVVATGWFSDVPEDHQYVDAIRWTQEQELFRGYPDGRFGPDEELTEGQFSKVIDRLFDSADRWTRAETAEFLYHGYHGIREETPTTTRGTLSWDDYETLDSGISVVGNNVIRVWVRDFYKSDLRGQLDITFTLEDIGFFLGHNGDTAVQIGMDYSSNLNIYYRHFPYSDDLCGQRVQFQYTHPLFEGGVGDVGDRTQRDIPCLHSTTTTTTTQPTTTTTTTYVDPLVKVAVLHDDHDNFHIQWYHPEWLGQTWHWMVQVPEETDPAFNGVRCQQRYEWNQWYIGTSATGRHDDGGLGGCIYKMSYFKVILWWVEERYEHHVTCTRLEGSQYFRGYSFDCNTPSDWQQWPHRSW